MDQGSPLGTISARPGPALAAADRFYVTIKGKGGHGAHPNLTHDPIAIGAQIVTALQTVVAREIDPVEPAVCTVGAFISGEAANVIPDTAILRGTLRSFSPDVRIQLAEAVERIIRNVAASMRAEVEYDYAAGYPATINDNDMTELVLGIAREVVGEENVKVPQPTMGAEDFSYFLEKKPGCFYFVGSVNEERGLTWGHHHPRFDIDEESMVYGMDVMIRTVLTYLGTD